MNNRFNFLVRMAFVKHTKEFVQAEASELLLNMLVFEN